MYTHTCIYIYIYIYAIIIRTHTYTCTHICAYIKLKFAKAYSNLKYIMQLEIKYV